MTLKINSIIKQLCIGDETLGSASEGDGNLGFTGFVDFVPLVKAFVTFVVNNARVTYESMVVMLKLNF